MVLPFLCDRIQKARGIVIAIPPANCYNRNNKPGEGTCVDKLNFMRKNKDFKTADAIRDELKAKGIILEDTPQGVKWSRA